MDSNNLFAKVSIQDLVKIGIQKDVIGQLVSEYEFGERTFMTYTPNLYLLPSEMYLKSSLRGKRWEHQRASILSG